MKNECYVCKKDLTDIYDVMEYRGALSCVEHFDECVEKRDFNRKEIIEEERHKTKWLNKELWNSPLGKANRKALSKQLDIVIKESGRIKDYEK